MYDRYADRAYRVARALSPDDAQAEDAVREGFVSIRSSPPSDRPTEPTAAALVLVAVGQRAIDRVSGREHPQGASTNADEHSTAHNHVGAEAASVHPRDLIALLGKLPDAERLVIVLAMYGELTRHEIAQELGFSIATVTRRMRSGLRSLRGDIPGDQRRR